MIHRRYTPLGNRIAELGSTQSELIKVLKVGQQTISKKLRGECSISVSDLEKLAKYFKVPMTFFFEAEGLDGSVLRDFHAMFKARPQEVYVILDAFRADPNILAQLAAFATPLTAGLRGTPCGRKK